MPHCRAIALRREYFLGMLVLLEYAMPRPGHSGEIRIVSPGEVRAARAIDARADAFSHALNGNQPEIRVTAPAAHATPTVIVMEAAASPAVVLRASNRAAEVTPNVIVNVSAGASHEAVAEAAEPAESYAEIVPSSEADYSARLEYPAQGIDSLPYQNNELVSFDPQVFAPINIGAQRF